jgi:hypothetical protein
VGISGQILAAWLKARLVFLTNPDGANAWVEETAKTERRAAADRRLASTSQHGPMLSAHSLTSTHDDGWKSINVFYGNSSHIADSSSIPSEYFEVNRWFSQYRQDEVVSHLLFGKRNSYFVDLASNDAVRISNTSRLRPYLTGMVFVSNRIRPIGVAFPIGNVLWPRRLLVRTLWTT